MDSDSRFKTSIGFIDLLFNILLGFAFLFIIAFLLIKPEQKKADFERRAEFVVVICGAIMTMPGLPRVPAADSIKLNNKGDIEGLF